MRRKKSLNLFLFVLIGFITLGIGYAAISNISLTINGTGSITATQSNFDVRFLDVTGHEPSITPGSPNTVSVLGNTEATFDVSTLSKKGDTAVATIDVKNNSNGIGAEISLELTNSNETYFKVTEHIADAILQANDITTVTVTIEMLKTPISADEVTSITARLIAEPVENTSATGTAQKQEILPDPRTYTVNNSSNKTYINQAMPAGVTKHPSFAVASAAYGYPASLAHVVENNLITESYIAVEINSKVYYLRGGVTTDTLQSSPVYDENVRTLKKAYGSNWSTSCSEDVDEYKEIVCYDTNSTQVVRSTGFMNIYESGWDCYIETDGSSYCNK